MPRGRPFPKGTSGNPGGRPAELGQFRALCREKTPEALNALSVAMADPDHAVAAAKVLLEFGWGKPTQPIAGEGGEALRVVIEKLPPEKE